MLASHMSQCILLSQTGCVRSEGSLPPAVEPLESIDLAERRQPPAASQSDAGALPPGSEAVEIIEAPPEFSTRHGVGTVSAGINGVGISAGDHRKRVPSTTEGAGASRLHGVTAEGCDVVGGNNLLTGEPRDADHALSALKDEFRDICKAMML